MDTTKRTQAAGGDDININHQPPPGGQESSPSTMDRKVEDSWAAAGSASSPDPRIAVALEEYLEALNTGSPPSRREFLERHSAIAESLEDCLVGLEFIRSAGQGFCAGESSDPADKRERQNLPMTLRLGDYQILRQVGRGSMGVVYEARQISLGRQVALKVLPFAAAIDPRQRQRFLIEAQAAAQLHHPHIVPVFAAGCEQGVHFYAMQLVDGRSLAELIDEMCQQTVEPANSPEVKILQAEGPSVPIDPGAHADTSPTFLVFPESGNERQAGDPRPVTAISASGLTKGTTSGHRARSQAQLVARLGIQAAEALDHAHTLGIVHRDIKPANLLVDSKGELWITDFGLARLHGETSLTRSGDLVGTLRYMSPEQALARRGVVDQRTDIYALGLTLYEMLTLRPAFDGRDHHELLRQIAQDEPTPPRRINPSIPRDLETIILKAISKEPLGRYSTAQELARDLTRFVNDQPILARRPTIMERGGRWVRRHKQIVVTGLTVFLLALSLSTVLLLLQARKTELQAKQTEAVSQDRLTYIKGSFPFIDKITINAMGQATSAAIPDGQVPGQTDPAIEVYREALQLYEQAARIPPTDPESRKIVARATQRVGFTRAVWGYRQGGDRTLVNSAESSYRQSLALFESLLSELPGDREVRSLYADALGEWGIGWFLMMSQRPAESVPYYRQAIKLSRELALDPEVDLNTMASELDKSARLAETLAQMLEASGREDELRGLWRDLLAAFSKLEPRLEGRDGVVFSAALAGLIGRLGGSAKIRGVLRPEIEGFFRLATRLDPSNSVALNNMAWYLTSDPAAFPNDRALALSIASDATKKAPKEWSNWNTLGVAAYRAGDWKQAREALEKSMSLHGGGDAFDWFFLAMIDSKRKEPIEARKWYEQAKAWTRKNQPQNVELRRFQAEAEAILRSEPDSVPPRSLEKS